MNRFKILSKPGKLIVLSAPSGGGKSTIIKEILKQRPDCVYSVSCTTRPKREYEIEDIHYHFLDQEDFLSRIAAGVFLEWEQVHGDYYGTDRREIEAALSQGRSVLLDLDVNGGERILEYFPDSILIFIYPPSLDELRNRLAKRGSDSPEAIEKRLSRYPMEKAKGDCYPYRVVNDRLDETVERVLQILEMND